MAFTYRRIRMTTTTVRNTHMQIALQEEQVQISSGQYIGVILPNYQLVTITGHAAGVRAALEVTELKRRFSFLRTCPMISSAFMRGLPTAVPSQGDRSRGQTCSDLRLRNTL